MLINLSKTKYKIMRQNIMQFWY